MYQTKPDTFVLVVAAMSEKMVEQERTIMELSDHIRGDHEAMDDMQRTITGLRESLSLISANNENFDYMKRRADELYEQVRNLTIENARLKYGGNTPEETARAYMKAHGVDKWNNPNLGKIGTIKVVREITGWGLKETKDFCEAYMDRHERGEVSREESGPGTKRSSQSPALRTA